MPQQQLDYAVPRIGPEGRPVHLIIVLLAFVAVVALTEVLLIRVGNDRTPGNWNDMIVQIAFSPGANLILGLVFFGCSFALRRKWGGPIVLYIAFGFLVPLVGALVVGQSVRH